MLGLRYGFDAMGQGLTDIEFKGQFLEDLGLEYIDNEICIKRYSEKP